MTLVLVAALLFFQVGPRRALSPAETLVDTAILQEIFRWPGDKPDIRAIEGTSSDAGEIWLTCEPNRCELAVQAVQKIENAISYGKVPRPERSIRIVSTLNESAVPRVRAAIHVAQGNSGDWRILRGLWSTAGIGDEVAEIFAEKLEASVLPYESYGQLKLDRFGVPTTTFVTPAKVTFQQAFVVAASAYYLATLPNAGSEALLSHLTVGAHARLAEDGRKAVAQMGNQQRASADVLIMFGQAIEREQRRMRSFERFMPQPVDATLRSRIADMEKGITSVWTSMGITSSPFVPAAERIRGRGGDDRRVPKRTSTGPLPTPEPPTAFLKLPDVDLVLYELGNFIDGKRTVSDIRDAVSAEFTPIALPVVSDYFDRLAKTGAISLQ